MKLLPDQNLSPKLLHSLREEHAESGHVRDLGLSRAADEEIWEVAKEREFVIVSKDEDFHQRSFLRGPPPKVVWVKVGNRSTREILEALRRHADGLEAFLRDDTAAFLTIT